MLLRSVMLVMPTSLYLFISAARLSRYSASVTFRWGMFSSDWQFSILPVNSPFGAKCSVQPLGVDGRLADLRGLDRGVVQDLDAAVRILPGVHRGVRRGRFVEIGLVRQAPFPDPRHVDARQLHPRAGASLPRAGADPVPDLLNRMELDEHLRHLAACRAGGMHVRLDEAGDDGPPAGIDDTRLRTGHLADGSRRADGGEGVPAYRHRFRLGVRGVDGQHLRVDHHQVDGFHLPGWRRRDAEHA